MLRHAISAPCASSPCHAMPSQFSSQRIPSNPSRLGSCLVWASPLLFTCYLLVASPLPRLLLISLPFLCRSATYTAMLRHFRSELCASAGLVSKSARFGSCPSLAIAPPCLSGRIGSPQRRRTSCLHGSMPFLIPTKQGTSFPYLVSSGPVPASQSHVHSPQTKPG